MDGLTLQRKLSEVINEDLSTSGYLDARTSYEYLWEAATKFIDATRCCTTTQSITTVADQAAYTLSHDFGSLYMTDDYNRPYLKYNDGSNNHFIFYDDKEEVIYANQTTSVSIPSGFYIDDKTLSSTQETGTTTSDGAASAGECTLTDSGASFTDNVTPGDVVHNTTDGSTGYVLSVTSDTALVTALFGGTANDWTSGDAYVVNYQPRFKLTFDPPPSTAGHTVTVYHTENPDPVFSDYGTYRIPDKYINAIVKFAAFNYKYRDDNPNFGNAWYLQWDRDVKEAARRLNSTLRRKEIKVNLIRR